MCRFVAYGGPEIPLENIIILPRHSLLDQSQHATEAKLAVNGDGFGMAWYGDQERPGLYRDVLPAWSDGNLVDLCRMIRSRLFLAHIRASTFGETSRNNCHPFTYGKWSFMHNGEIADFPRLRRQFEAMLGDAYYAARRGRTDSELFFLLLLTNGLEVDPLSAISRTIAQIETVQGDVAEGNRITTALSDGQTIYAFRYSGSDDIPTLHLGTGLDHGGQVLASEPLDPETGNWTMLEANCLYSLREGVLTDRPLPG
ncbi:class II glutamine amidotransferase [Ruegeria jejuensis]|uniref:class II glutamine amidotransferase n=1 Tax=Ruegeria jejuensis TaxID=3233338 RepID=UPI00355BEAF1